MLTLSKKLFTLQTTPTPENNVEEANEIKKKEVKAKSVTKKAEEKAKEVAAETKPKEPEAKPKEANEVKPQAKPSVKAPEIVEPKETIRKPSLAKVPKLHKFYTDSLTPSHYFSSTISSFFMLALFIIIRWLDMILCVSYLTRKYLQSTCQI